MPILGTSRRNHTGALLSSFSIFFAAGLSKAEGDGPVQSRRRRACPKPKATGTNVPVSCPVGREPMGLHTSRCQKYPATAGDSFSERARLVRAATQLALAGSNMVSLLVHTRLRSLYLVSQCCFRGTSGTGKRATDYQLLTTATAACRKYAPPEVLTLAYPILVVR
jgi:hypothetical protein